MSAHEEIDERAPGVDELLDLWEQAWSGKDPDAFAAICSPNVSYEDPVIAEPLNGAEEIAAHAARLWAGFPDARLQKLGKRLTDGTFVAARACRRRTSSSSSRASSTASSSAGSSCGCGRSSTCTTPPCSSGCSRGGAR
jgi:hypothetical protein